MIETHHTPGPWAVAETFSPCVLIGDGYVQLPVNDEAQANARLIAAAPELLEALQRLSAQCTRLRLPGQAETDAEKTARAVIAKATGGAE